MFDPFIGLPFALYLHLGFALVALLLGPFAIYRRRRDRMHKTIGYVWVTAIGVAALSSFWLNAVILHFAFGFGAIHLLAVWVLLQLGLGVRDARKGTIAAHRARMSGLYWQGLTIAGLLTLLPGRVMNAFLFGDNEMIGLWVIGGAGLGLLAVNLSLAFRVPEWRESRGERG